MTPMATVVFIGESARVEPYRLAGAVVHPADDEPSVRRAWRELGPDVAVAVLTPRAARYLGLRTDATEENRPEGPASALRADLGARPGHGSPTGRDASDDPVDGQRGGSGHNLPTGPETGLAGSSMDGRTAGAGHGSPSGPGDDLGESPVDRRGAGAGRGPLTVVMP